MGSERTNLHGRICSLIFQEAASPATLTSVWLLIESVKRTAEYASDIAEIVLNLNVESVLG